MNKIMMCFFMTTIWFLKKMFKYQKTLVKTKVKINNTQFLKGFNY